MLENKTFQLDIYLLEATRTSNLGFTVSMATLNCIQNTQRQYLVINYIGNIYLKYL